MTSGFLREQESRAATLTRRSFVAGGATLAAGLTAFAATRGRHELETTHRTFAIRDLPDPFVGFRMVQISDIHLEEYTEPWYLERVIAQVNALKPDLVVLTGDFISRGPHEISVAWKSAGVCAEMLTALQAPQRYAILGNHDAAVGPDRVIAPMQAHGTPFLVDSYVPIERGDSRIWLCGAADFTMYPDFARAVPADPRAPVVLLCHEPDLADEIVQHPRFPLIDLMLSGHSHGGQIRLPLLGPLILPPMGRKYVEGLFHFDHMQMYVNRGVGTVGMPFRLYCPSEITEITLARA